MSRVFKIYFDKGMTLINLRNVVAVERMGKKVRFIYPFSNIDGALMLGSGSLSTSPYKQEYTYETEEEAIKCMETVEKELK